MEKADIQEVLNSHDAKSTEEDFEELTALIELQDKEDSDTLVVRPQLTTSALKRGLWLEDD